MTVITGAVRSTIYAVSLNDIVLPARSVASSTRSPDHVILIVQSTWVAVVCVHSKLAVTAVLAHETETLPDAIPTTSVTLIVVSVIVALSSLVGAVIAHTGGTGSIIYDCELLHCAPFILSSAHNVIVPLLEILFTPHTTGLAYGSVRSHPVPVHVPSVALVPHERSDRFVISLPVGVDIVIVVSVMVTLLIVVGAIYVITGGKSVVV